MKIIALFFLFQSPTVADEFELQIRKLRMQSAPAMVVVVRHPELDTVGMVKLFTSPELHKSLKAKGYGWELLDAKSERGIELLRQANARAAKKDENIQAITPPIVAFTNAKGELIRTFQLPRADVDLLAVVRKYGGK